MQQGETLWGLAQQYLGDPMLWPELYRLNTTVVEDPHWIYPGEELQLTAPPATATVTPDTTVVVQQQNLTVTPSVDTVVASGPSTSPMTGSTIFSQRAPSRRISNISVEASTNRAYRAVRAGEYFSSGFLTEGQVLNTGRVVQMSSTMRTTAQLYENIVISPPTAEGVQSGDLMLAFRRTDEVGDYGQIVVPTGLVRVRGAAGTGNNLLEASVIALYGPLDQGQELLRIQPFSSTTNQRAVPVTDGVEGHVIRMRDERGVPEMQDVLFFDKGANDGLRTGDMMMVYIVRPNADHGGTVEVDQGRALVVNTRSRTSTAVIVALYRSDLGRLSQVRQVRRMPS